MCGIAGVYCQNFNNYENLEVVKKMIDRLSHRGPDGEGLYQDGPVVLGHRRLAIIDLSENGRQPMESQDQTHCIIYNGEIYNYKELRYELEEIGYSFQSQSDTEVILQAYRAWGPGCLSRFNGMWSFAIWDRAKQELFCARDRFAIKPFVYYFDGAHFIFASEIKGLLQHPLIRKAPNYQAIYDFVIYGRVNHTEESFFRNIFQLPGAHYAVVNREGMRIQRYWDIDGEYQFPGNLADAAAEFYRIFEDAVRLRFRSDVEVASCLSGGLDSSSIVCTADKLITKGQILTNHRLNTFSLAFDYPQYDERKWVELVQHQTQINTHFTIPTEADLGASLDHLIDVQEEPFGSTSIFGQYMVMRLIQEKGIKVTLDGQGSDEMLGGYTAYADAYFADLLKRGDREYLLRQIDLFCQKHQLTPSIAQARAEQLANTRKLGRHIEVNSKYLTEDFAESYHHEIPLPNKFDSLLQDQLYQDLVYNSIPSLLRFEDRNSMAFSIESRVPFLDYRLVEFIFSLPAEMKIKDAVSKVVLRKAMHGTIPVAIEERQDKMGFVTPEAIWFRGGLQSVFEEIYHGPKIAAREIFNLDTIRREWQDFKAKVRNDSFLIWRIASVELWFQKFMD